jgi:hypothetical protein
MMYFRLSHPNLLDERVHDAPQRVAAGADHGELVAQVSHA